MKFRRLVSGLALMMFFASSLQALEVGDWGRCVVLEQVNTQKKYSCIMRPVSKDIKYTLLAFGTPQCEDCTTDLSYLKDLATKTEGKATIRYILSEASRSAFRGFLAKHGELLNYPVSFDDENDAKMAYSIKVKPTYYLLEKKKTGMHKILFKHEGVLSSPLLDEISNHIIPIEEPPKEVPEEAPQEESVTL